MANFDNFWDAVASFDIVDPIEGVISSYANADWRGAIKRHGILGIGREFVASATGHNSPVIAFKRHAGWSGIAGEQLLKRHGVKIYGRGFTKTTLLFKVERRQSRWATYLMKRAGVPVVVGYWVPKDATWETTPRSAEPPYRKDFGVWLFVREVIYMSVLVIAAIWVLLGGLRGLSW